jgi:hypothetical protein
VFSAAISPATNAIYAVLMTSARRATPSAPSDNRRTSTVLGALRQRAGSSGPSQEASREPERAAARPEADVVLRRQLVDRPHQGASLRRPTAPRDPARAHWRRPGRREREREREQPGPSPRGELASCEEEWRNRRTLPDHARIQRDRRGHIAGIITTHPPRKPARRSKARPGPVVHAPPPVDRRPPAETGESEEQGDEPEPPASSCERGSETCAASDAIPRRGDPWFNQPRRTQTSRARSCPRTRCRKR